MQPWRSLSWDDKSQGTQSLASGPCHPVLWVRAPLLITEPTKYLFPHKVPSTQPTSSSFRPYLELLNLVTAMSLDNSVFIFWSGCCRLQSKYLLLFPKCTWALMDFPHSSMSLLLLPWVLYFLLFPLAPGLWLFPGWDRVTYTCDLLLSNLRFLVFVSYQRTKPLAWPNHQVVEETGKVGGLGVRSGRRQ